MSVPPARRHAPELILAAACWGVGTAASKQALAEMPPVTLLPVQLAASMAFLLVVARARGERSPSSPESRRLGRLGLLNPGLAYALSLLGLAQVTASMSVLLWALEPVLILLLAVLFLGERPGVALGGLSVVSLAGVALVLYDPTTSGAAVGIALTVAGVACCAVYTVVSRRWLPTAGSSFGVVVIQQAYALAFAFALLVGAAVVGATVRPTDLTIAGVVSAGVSGLVYYGVAYWLYLSALRRVPASVAAAAFYLIPVFGLAAAAVVGDRLTIVQLVGAGLVIGAVAAITLGGARTARPIA